MAKGWKCGMRSYMSRHSGNCTIRFLQGLIFQEDMECAYKYNNFQLPNTNQSIVLSIVKREQRLNMNQATESVHKAVKFFNLKEENPQFSVIVILCSLPFLSGTWFELCYFMCTSNPLSLLFGASCHLNLVKVI